MCLNCHTVLGFNHVVNYSIAVTMVMTLATCDAEVQEQKESVMLIPPGMPIEYFKTYVRSRKVVRFFF